jgi:flagellar basal body P-ring protein FlgI
MKSFWTVLFSGVILLGGCSWWRGLTTVRSQSPEESPEKASTRLIGDLAVPFGMYPVQVEAVGLVTGLRGTGSDPRPSPQRQLLLSQLQSRGVDHPNALMASPNTSLVLVRALLRPGIQKGDRFDVEVRVPSQSDTTSLRGGWLMEVDLQEMQVMQDNQIHSGKITAKCEGPILVDPAAHGKEDRVLLTRGRILGGGVANQSRSVGLVLKPESQSILNASRIETAVNRRFHIFQKGVKIGVAKALTDQYVELKVHPKYKDNMERYVQVVRATAIKENEKEQIERLPILEKQLLDPVTTTRAAMQLEAIGKGGEDTLKKGLTSTEAEVRFRSAESLAYLDDASGAAVLAQIARDEPAFRVYALAAMAVLDDISSSEQLRQLLDVPSAETRYGAFRSLWTMNSRDPLVAGERLGNQFSYHVLNTQGPPLVHITKSKRPEVVLFGGTQEFNLPLAVEAGNQILVTSDDSGRVIVSRFAANQPDQKRFVSSKVNDVIRAVVDLGGTYPDVVQALQEAKAHGSLAARFEVDALPEAGRTYSRFAGDEKEKRKADTSDGDTTGTTPSEEDSHPVRAWFAKMRGKDPE